MRQLAALRAGEQATIPNITSKQDTPVALGVIARPAAAPAIAIAGPLTKEQILDDHGP